MTLEMSDCGENDDGVHRFRNEEPSEPVRLLRKRATVHHTSVSHVVATFTCEKIS